MEKITLKITRPNGIVHDERFDTENDAYKCAKYLPKGTRWQIWKGSEHIDSGWA